MSGRQGYYSLIQFCPDRFRSEAANVGVLVFCGLIHRWCVPGYLRRC